MRGRITIFSMGAAFALTLLSANGSQGAVLPVWRATRSRGQILLTPESRIDSRLLFAEGDLDSRTDHRR